MARSASAGRSTSALARSATSRHGTASSWAARCRAVKSGSSAGGGGGAGGWAGGGCRVRRSAAASPRARSADGTAYVRWNTVTYHSQGLP